MEGYNFTVRSLGTALPSSLPLVLSNEMQYDSQTHSVKRVPSEQAGSKLVIIQSSLNLIKSLGTKPLAVLSICGPYRSGKSYFLSRFFGSQETFKVSNSDDPCTQGIWMSTSVLECDNYSILLLDTEGMESLEAAQDYIVKLLVVATVSSSMLIYNSIGIPSRNDLESLSELTNATSCIMVKSGAESDDLYNYFPKFLWLVRDAALTLDETPTEYLKDKVLVRSSKATPDKIDCIVQTIISLFPSIECRMLPRPTTDLSILADMLTNESQLNPEFVQRLNDVIAYVRSNIKPQTNDETHGKVHGFSGIVIAELLEQYVRALNLDQSIVLHSCWQSAFQSALYAYSNNLICKYRKDMKEALESELPLELGEPLQEDRNSSDHPDVEVQGQTLFEIHSHIASVLYADLCHEIEVLLDSSDSSDIASSIKEEFQRNIAVYDTCNCQVESGELLHFINENYDKSVRYCQSVFDKLYSSVDLQVTNAYRDKKQLDIGDDIKSTKSEYLKKAIGPAKEEVLKLGVIKLQTASDALTDIPGPPAHLKATFIAKDRVTIRWSGAAFNTSKITRYTAEYAEAMAAKKEWKSIPVVEFEATASDLKPHTKYLFRVHAYVNEYKSCESTTSVTTKVSSAIQGAAAVGAFVGGTLVTPVAATTINPILAPAMTVVGLFGAPVVGGYCAKKVYKKYGEEDVPYYPWRPL